MARVFNPFTGKLDYTTTKDVDVESMSITINWGWWVIVAGQYGGYFKMPYACTITWRILSEGSSTPISSTTTMDVWKKSSFYPTVADALVWTDPSLAGATNNSETGLSIAVTAGDWITFNVVSNIGAKILTLQLNITKT